MQLLVFWLPSLSFQILSDGILVATLSDSVDEISTGPEGTTPEIFFHLGDSLEYFSRCYALHKLCYMSWAIRRHRLDQEMRMVSINPNLDEHHLIPLRNLKTNILQFNIHSLAEDRSSILRRTNQMVQ